MTFSNRPLGWRFDEIPQDFVHDYGVCRLEAGDIALFHGQFGPYLPMRAQEAGDAKKGPPAAQAHIYALWTRMLWSETRDWPVLRRLGQDALRYYAPVYAGDVLCARMSFVGKDDIGPDRGILIAAHEVMNQDGALIMSVMTRTVLAKAPL